MKPVIATGIEKRYGDRVVLRGADLAVEAGERVGLVGANGAGKSTLVRILVGEEWPDHGEVQRQGRLAYLAQEPVLPGATVEECLQAAMAWHAQLLAGYHRALEAGELQEAAGFQDRLDVVGWQVEHRVDAILERLDAPPRDARVATLSGGERRRVALACALVGGAEALLLDEPTNHLDAAAITWLEGYLAGYPGAVILVTHDRYMLEAVVSRVVEIEDGVSVSYDGSYGDYVVARAERHALLHRDQERRIALIAQEAAWAARSPSARQVKQKARLQRLDELRRERPWRPPEQIRIDLRTGEKFGGTLLDAQRLRKRYGPRTILDDLSFSLAPGDRLGIVGPNGVGKSTLLKLIAGRETPDSGSVQVRSRAVVGILDQARGGLKDDDTVWEAAGNGNDHVFVAGEPVHVITFLERFLFTREHMTQRVKSLSGGERARLLLAKLLLDGASLLLLDEPTNDLDLMTLRVLEEALLSFDGAAVIVTHDRAFLDRTCTTVLAFEGAGKVVRYADRLQAEAALQAKRAAAEAAREAAARAERAAAPAAQKAPPKRDKLSYREQQELAALPAKIEALEAEQAKLAEKLADPAIYRGGGAEVTALTQRLQAVEKETEALYERWTSLEARA